MFNLCFSTVTSTLFGDPNRPNRIHLFLPFTRGLYQQCLYNRANERTAKALHLKRCFNSTLSQYKLL